MPAAGYRHTVVFNHLTGYYHQYRNWVEGGDTEAQIVNPDMEWGIVIFECERIHVGTLSTKGLRLTV